MAVHGYAQGFGGGRGGFGGGTGGFGGTGRRSGSSGSTRTYPGNGMIGDATITVDPETRRVIVITDDETSEQIKEVISNLDRPKPQVLINVVFLEATYRKGMDLGIEGGTTKKLDNNTSLLASNIFGLAAQGASPTPPGAGLYQIAGNDYTVVLRAIASAGKLEILSRPSILARNNQEATITVGQQVPLITNVRYDNFGNQINGVTYQDVGIILRVTPFINSNGMVEMILAPETSTLTEQSVPIAVGVGAPIIATRSADTVVVTPDGQTVIIGGLMQTTKIQTDSKIPFLGDIPGLGLLFKHRVTDNVKTELIILLTPHIVTQPGDLAALTRSEHSRAQFAPKAFTEDEMNRFIDNLPLKTNAVPDVPTVPPAKSAENGKKNSTANKKTNRSFGGQGTQMNQ